MKTLLIAAVLPLAALAANLAEFKGEVGEKTGWKCVGSEAGKIVYIPFEGYYESKGGRIESPRFKLDGEIGKNCFYRLAFSAKCPVDGYWWVDFFDKDGNPLPDVNSRLYASEDWTPYDVMVPAHPAAAFGQIAFVTKKGAQAKDVSIRRATVEEAAKWCDDFAATLPKMDAPATAGAWEKLPKSRAKILSGKPVNVVFLGDSIINDTWCGNAVALIQHALPKADLRCFLSVRGSTGCWYYHEKEHFDEYVAKYRPDLVVIGGISNFLGLKRHSYKEVEDNMAETIARCQAIGAEVVVCTPPPSYEFRKDAAAKPFDRALTTEAGNYQYLQQEYERRAAARTLAQVWDLTTAPCEAIARSGKPLNWFKRDAAHSDDRGKQLIAQTTRAYFKACAAEAESTLDYAAAEAKRLMRRTGVACSVTTSQAPFGLSITCKDASAAPFPSVGEVRFDGYAVSVSGNAYAIAAKSEKGVLNGLYALAERLGFAFVEPGEAGERAPSRLKPLADGVVTENPRFKYRGIFSSSKPTRFTARERYAFYAKLRFNAMTAHISGDAIEAEDFAKQLGLRLEIGGHGMSACLPREMYEKEPELFRMFQPEDFGGKRLKDSNFCSTNPKTREIVKANFTKKVVAAVRHGYHAVHGWADDLPGGGWCMCSRCRALSGTEQSQYVMNLEAQAVREAGLDMRVPAIAYHDTMFPSETIDPDPLCYCLFAPRERCYAHALNDASCALNRHYFAALKAWMARYRGIDDSHTFEYYNDKLLFRGHTPYLPDVILGDADTYEAAGIECWMSLQVGGDALAPDWNMLAHALIAWRRGLTREQLTLALAERTGGAAAKAWQAYLDARATAYETAWQVCTIPNNLYFDYRFMPERPSKKGGKEIVDNLAAGEARLASANAALAGSTADMDGFAKAMAEEELRRSAFEAKDLAAMTAHQRGLTAIADVWNGADKATLSRGLEDLRAAVGHLKEAKELYAVAAGTFTDNQYYFGFIDRWTVPEIENKIRVYSRR